MKPGDRILDVAEAAKRLCLTKETVYVLINNGKLDHIKVGRKKGYRVPESSIAKYIDFKRKNSKQYVAIGQRFGKLVVKSFAEKIIHADYWWCVCDCGMGVKVRAYNLRTGHAQSCGCKNTLLLEAGQRFGRLVVLRLADMFPGREAMYDCKCDCGNIISVNKRQLIKGEKKSCGCLNADATRKMNRERRHYDNRLYDLGKTKRYSTVVSDGFVRGRLTDMCSLTAEDIPAWLISLKRDHILLLRELKKLNKTIKEMQS